MRHKYSGARVEKCKDCGGQVNHGALIYWGGSLLCISCVRVRLKGMPKNWRPGPGLRTWARRMAKGGGGKK
jgi:hypothetical protein